MLTNKTHRPFSSHEGSCMAHVNCFPTGAADVNFWFFIAVPFCGGCWYKAKCEMLLRKIEGQMNVQNCRFSAKWKRWRHAPRLTPTAVVKHSRHRLLKRWHIVDFKNIAGDDQAILMVHRNSATIVCTFQFYVCLRLRDCNYCSAADGNGSCHSPTPSYFEEMTRCWHQKLHWKWPGNPNGRSKFRNLRLLTFTRSQLTLRRRLHRWWRLPEIAQTACSRHKKTSPGMTRID